MSLEGPRGRAVGRTGQPTIRGVLRTRLPRRLLLARSTLLCDRRLRDPDGRLPGVPGGRSAATRAASRHRRGRVRGQRRDGRVLDPRRDRDSSAGRGGPIRCALVAGRRHPHRLDRALDRDRLGGRGDRGQLRVPGPRRRVLLHHPERVTGEPRRLASAADPRAPSPRPHRRSPPKSCRSMAAATLEAGPDAPPDRRTGPAGRRDRTADAARLRPRPQEALPDLRRPAPAPDRHGLRRRRRRLRHPSRERSSASSASPAAARRRSGGRSCSSRRRPPARSSSTGSGSRTSIRTTCGRCADGCRSSSRTRSAR